MRTIHSAHVINVLFHPLLIGLVATATAPHQVCLTAVIYRWTRSSDLIPYGLFTHVARNLLGGLVDLLLQFCIG